jgi:hypothetical protein
VVWTDGYDMAILNSESTKNEDGYASNEFVVTRHEIIVALLRYATVSLQRSGLVFL